MQSKTRPKGTHPEQKRYGCTCTCEVAANLRVKRKQGQRYIWQHPVRQVYGVIHEPRSDVRCSAYQRGVTQHTIRFFDRVRACVNQVMRNKSDDWVFFIVNIYIYIWLSKQGNDTSSQNKIKLYL